MRAVRQPDDGRSARISTFAGVELENIHHPETPYAERDGFSVNCLKNAAADFSGMVNSG